VAASLKTLADQIRKTREKRSMSRQDFLSVVTGMSDSDLDRLESGEKLPRRETVEAVCKFLAINDKHWKPLFSTQSTKRKRFEDTIEELIGVPVSLERLDQAAADAADRVLDELMGGTATADQALSLLNRLLTFYGISHMSKEFFDHYISPRAFASDSRLREAVEHYQIDAIRLFSSFTEAYETLNHVLSLLAILAPLSSMGDSNFRERRPWQSINNIDEDRLADLGYISAAQFRKERGERTALSEFLRDLAEKHEEKGPKEALGSFSQDKLRRMDALLRTFSSTIPHGFLSPLFVPDADALRREAERLGPKEEQDLSRMERTQSAALQNLSNYLTADYMDVYVATSMRTAADFVSVNRFVTALFSYPDIAPLNLRYFNPTQSWIEDRVAKGLVEALMLRRAFVTIYMAQKEDTFGKDSEASVALGQGKPVIVYVPRLYVPDLEIDSSALGLMPRNDLAALVANEGSLASDKEIDATFDREALHGRILTIRLEKGGPDHFAEIARTHWADFDLYGETDRFTDEAQRRMFRGWLDAVVKLQTSPTLPASLIEPFRKMVVAITMRFERRAEIFREVHPLALQVILSTGVLNGILVVRSVESCAELLSNVIRNELNLELKLDESNYRVVETRTKSTIRVISRNRLLSNAFRAFYRS
jgi:transcriptional regulator with XRE-family HTH domain